MTSILWRRTDTPGHDACRLEQNTSGWRLQGMSIFRHDGMPVQLNYEASCDLDWGSQQAQVRGFVGDKALEFNIQRSGEGLWSMNGTGLPNLQECVDLDLGFTPATNLLVIRRLNLAEGQSADAPAAWLDVAAGTLEVLPQRYERRTKGIYWYEAPRVDYKAFLEVMATGFVRRYPGLWEAQAC